MLTSAAAESTARTTSGRVGRAADRAAATAGGADRASRSEATTTLWNACTSCSGPTRPKTAVSSPKTIADAAMIEAIALNDLSRRRESGLAATATASGWST